MLKKIFKNLFIFIFIIIALFSFYRINKVNYIKHNEIKNTIIEHPENLPEKTIAKATSFGYKNIKADIYWIETIQYIGSNAVHSEYKKYLFEILDLVTDLNPYFEKPYIIGQLLLPSYQPNYEYIDFEQQKIHEENAIKLGLKGIENFCDKDKIKAIENENDLLKIWNNSDYQNPCFSYKIPYYLAYIYYYYNNNPVLSAKYYKISSANTDSPEGAKTMAAIMQGKGGNREKSFFMFLNLAKFIEPDNEVCNIFSKELENIGIGLFINKNLKLNGDLIKKVDEIIENTFANIEQDDLTEESQCSNYINKSVRELNLEYVSAANKIYFNEKGKNSYNAKQLYDEGFLEYLPIDFQQNDDYGVIYIYNRDTNNYDYDTGRY